MYCLLMIENCISFTSVNVKGFKKCCIYARNNTKANILLLLDRFSRQIGLAKKKVWWHISMFNFADIKKML